MRIIFVAILLAMLGGCVNKINLTVYSEPPGAEIWEGDKYFGRAPVDLVYQVNQDNRKEGVVRTNGLSAVWLSGISAKNMLVLKVANGEKQYFNFYRYRSAGGDYEKDVRFGEDIMARRNAESIEIYNAIAPMQTQTAASMNSAAYSLGQVIGMTLAR